MFCNYQDNFCSREGLLDPFISESKESIDSAIIVEYAQPVSVHGVNPARTPLLPTKQQPQEAFRRRGQANPTIATLGVISASGVQKKFSECNLNHRHSRLVRTGAGPYDYIHQIFDAGNKSSRVTLGFQECVEEWDEHNINNLIVNDHSPRPSIQISPEEINTAEKAKPSHYSRADHSDSSSSILSTDSLVKWILDTLRIDWSEWGFTGIECIYSSQNGTAKGPLLGTIGKYSLTCTFTAEDKLEDVYIEYTQDKRLKCLKFTTLRGQAYTAGDDSFDATSITKPMHVWGRRLGLCTVGFDSVPSIVCLSFPLL